MSGPTRKRPKRSARVRPSAVGRYLSRIWLRRSFGQILRRALAVASALVHWVGGFLEVALVLLAAVMGAPGWLDKPWWARPVVLGSIVVVGIYGKGRTERIERERSQNERMAFAATTRDLLREEREREAEEREREAERRERVAAAEEIATIEAEVATLETEVATLAAEGQ